MNTFNNFSPLAFREKSMKATYKKWYAYGKEFALPFSTTELPPFQFTVTNLPSFDPTTVEVFLVNEATGVRSGTGIKIKVDTMDKHNSVLYVSPGSNVYAKSVEPGVYRAEFAIPEGETYVSTPICVTDGIETNTNFVKLEYWNDEKLAYPNGFVTTGTDNDFKFQMYIPTTFFKPKYEFEEEITKRAGYKFLELQTCNKVFGFNFLAPEYICDALRLVRLSDYIRFTHDGEYYNALNFEYTPDWQDNGYLAAIECQFETDTIIQKLPSFNRRDRESFYNALLADIDTPILFSPDVVGLYYREYKQGEPTIKGKLIRELSPIDLIDEKTTIAVDMGAGEARKFNLYRMLEGYISKNHEDVTEFLLSLRGGVNIGTPNTSGEYPASVDRDGNTKLKDIQGNDATLNNITGKDATFKTVETGFLTVNKTSATIDGMGNANVTDLTARGDSMLRSDVYTGFKNGSHTGKITKEGQLQYLSAIIYEFLSSETFVPGFLGEGFKIWLENGNWHIECDNLTVRQTMNIFELLIQKIRSVNGAIVVSQSNGKVAAVEDTGTQYKITFGEEFPTFQEGDLIRCQSWSKNNLKFYWVEVKTAADGYVLCDKSEFNNVVPAVGDEVVQMGNTKNAERQALIYITAQESGKPYIEILNGVKTKSLTGTDRTRLGDLSNIVDPDFTGEAAVKGTGFYSTNAFLKGIFVLRNGKRVEDEIQVSKDAAAEANRNAEAALSAAETAKNRLDKWASDGFISPTEKPALIDEKKRTQSDYSQLVTQSNKYGVSTAALKTAFDAYVAQLDAHTAATPESIPVNPLLATTQAAYYSERVKSLNAISDATKALVDSAQSSADKAAQDAANAQGTANEAKNRIDKWADDGFISPTEKPALVDEKKRVEAEYLQIKADADRYGISVDQYTTAKTNYIAELDYHTTPTPESIAVRPALKSTQTIYYDRRNGALNAIAAAAKAAADAAKAAADKAAQDAANAQGTANAAKDRLNKWADDGYISPTEKPALIDEGKRIQAEYLQIKANADKYGVPIPQYTEAYNNYLNELRYHSAATPEDIAVRPELAQSQTTYYDKRNGALNAIATASKDYVDNADKKLKEYLDTEITAVPGKIELAVRSLKVADVNLLKGAYRELKNANYGFGAYSYDVPLVNGKEYMLTVCYTLSANNTHIEAYANGGSNFLANFATKGDKVIESKKVTMAGYKPAEGLSFYQFPDGTYGSKVHWAVLTDGNLGVTSWIPSASEKNVGLKNLCSFKRITDAGFTYAKNYEDDGSWYISARLLNSETNVANKDMFGLTYDPNKQYYLFIDAAKRTDTETDKPSTFFIIKYTDGSEDRVCVVYPDKVTYNFITTQKPISKIVGSFGNGYGATIRVGLYETNFPVSWSPAPEDQLYQSVKYTDTQILAVDGKIELSVTTKVNQIGVGGDNLVRYYSDEFDCYPPYNSIPIVKDSYAIETTWNGSNTSGVLTVKNKRIKNGEIPNFCYRFRMLINGVPATEDRIADKRLTTYAVSGEMYYDEDGNFYGFVKGNIDSWLIHVPTTGMKGGDVIRIENFIVAKGTVCPGFSPASADISFLNERFTQSKIDIVEGKITSTVEQINSVDGKVTGLASRVTQTEQSITSVVGDINTLNNTTDRHITKQVDLTGWDNNKFFPLVIQIPTYYKAKVVINRPLNAAYGKPSYATHKGGFSMNLSFEMSGSGWGSLPAVTNIFDYTRAWNTGKIVVDLGQITQSSTCVMGLRGGSKYDVTLHEDTNPAAINVYQTDYVGPYGQVFPVRTDGAEPFRTYGYYSEIKQTQESLSATVAKVDDQGNRLSAAELTLSSDHAKLGVVEQTANTANTTATSANNKADATNKGLVETGINITSRKIVLKSDNFLFQNNAGQQTAALNANGRLSANVIEAGEVVANGFAAQRITTGNLTVTDGAVIAGMTITGGVLTGKNINITDGARVGSFTISSGIFSAQEVPAGIQMTLAGNAATFDSSGVRVENNSGSYALTTTGKGKIFLTGSDFWVQCKDVDFMGAQTWKAPGVFYACTILANGAIGKTWGNPDFHIKRVTKNSTGRYTVETTGSNGDYFVMITPYNVTSWLSTTVEPYSEGQFTYKVFDVNNGMTDSAVIIYFCGMVR